MMHQSTDKIKRIFIYILIFLFASTIFNFQILNSFLKLFKINKILIKNIAYQKEFNFFEGQNIFKGEDSKNLPFIEGTLEMNKINNFLKKIQLSNLSLNKMEKLVYYPSNRWDVIFNDKTILKLPSEQITTNIKRAEILLRTKDFKSKVIDLRIKDKLILYNE